MYPLLCIFMIVLGIVLFAFVKKTVKDNGMLVMCIRIIGGILIVSGFLMLYFLLSGRLTLPLSKN